MKKSTKKYLIDKEFKKTTKIRFQETHSIKSKCLKYVVKKTLPSI